MRLEGVELLAQVTQQGRGRGWLQTHASLSAGPVLLAATLGSAAPLNVNAYIEKETKRERIAK